ncbi:serine/threonine protein kinase [Mucilaginibacter limnophilus]|uniref:Serine/threonine protein kinase n=1 Tax=Mucilaginibacter limnophilus TaxID=1932778 RepID=A0A437MIB5_9SPHI|nr:serine/threonine-protein kinase [Mucilaginibacter limnophilus]RVT97363.1 serine/threonine protein kinase [Mucilaginibacter limnophilus]
MSKVFTITEGLENLGALRTGGQGSVYKGRRTGAIYSAVKLIPTPIYTEDESDKNYRNFQNEVTKLQKVNEHPNPNVVKILSSGITESGSFPFIEMEYIEGPDLGELLQPPHDKIFTLKELIKVAEQLACALAHCHKVGVKHGDIKSNNVKYNIHTGNYVLLDFGLAIMSEEQRRSSIRHAGAIEFMAPEQHEGKMLLQTDIYSYGIVLYELLTGQVPFPLPGGNADTGRNTVMLMHMEGEIPEPLQLRKANLPDDWSVEKKTMEMQVPAWFTAMLQKCLEKDPENRFADGKELHDNIIHGSMATSAGQTASLNTFTLETENKRLQEQLRLWQQTSAGSEKQLASINLIAGKAGLKYDESRGIYERDRNMVHLPKRGFIGLVGVAALFMALFLYSFLSKNKTADNSTATTATIAKPYRSPFIFIKRYNHDSVLNAQRDSIANAKRLLANKSSLKSSKKISHRPQKKKKKKKKFLGIF